MADRITDEGYRRLSQASYDLKPMKAYNIN